MLLGVVCPLRADVDYQTDIKPIFEEKCGACHGVLKQESGVRLDAGSLIRGDGEPHGLLNLEDPSASLLIQRVKATDVDERMPPEGEGTPLSDAQVQLLIEWIRLGAPSPPDEVVIESPSEHWAYQRPVKPEPAPDAPEAWSANPIDRLMFTRWRETGVVPAQLAAPATALRRLHFDVTGLPPTLDDRYAMLNDSSDEAWRDRVDHLLDDPAYGETWGRHWMDVWRYSDWDGYKNELRGSQRHIWHWRDWIVESLNADKGYDAMTREMLAGDELEPENLNVLRATGFLVRNFHKANRDIWLDATVEHTAKAFLGMTVACARCHDHKYDPISQREYYAFRAIFEPHRVRTERLPGQPDTGKQGIPRAYDADLDTATYLYVRGNEKAPDKDQALAPAVPEIIDAPFEFGSIDLSNLATHPYLRDYIETEDRATATRRLQEARDALANQISDETKDATHTNIARQQVTLAEANLASLDRRWAATKAKIDEVSTAGQLAIAAARAERALNFQKSLLDVLQQRVVVSEANSSEQTDEAKRKNAIESAEKSLAESDRKLVEASVNWVTVDDAFTPVGKSYPSSSSGRRSALALWITHPDNPLTARVAINHIWMRYFDEPLVENVDDFGLRSPRPIHQELLDYLAVELMENGWSMKHIHRLILNSRLYRIASSPTPPTPQSAQTFAANAEIDPDNKYFWRANVRRLSAEQVRDNLLAVAGTLDRTMGGPDIDFRDGEKTLRRSLYFRHAYEKQMPMLVLFDAANPTDCYRRSESIVPQQALALANSPLAVDQARQAAKRISQDVDDESSFVERAYLVILGRKASADESSACESFLERQTELLSTPEHLSSAGGTATTTVSPATDASGRARENLVHVLLNHNDFVTVR